MSAAGLTLRQVEAHDAALQELVDAIRSRLLGVQLVAKLKEVEMPGFDLAHARELARTASVAIANGSLGYALMVAEKQLRSE